MRVTGGAVAQIPAEATAFQFRSTNAMLTLAAMWPDPDDPGTAHREWARAAWRKLRQWSAGGGYLNHLCEERPDRVRETYGEAAWHRLGQLKQRYDPDNVFQLNQNIPPGR